MHIRHNYTHGGDIYTNTVHLDFSANVNPLGTPPEVVEAAAEAAGRMGIYPDPYCTKLREKLAQKWSVDRDCILCGNGAAELIFQFVQALKPQNALLPVPSFSEYASALRAVDCAPTYLYLQREAGFALQEDILREITPQTELLMLCTPNNPTGAAIPWELQLQILDRCRETGTWLLLDECFVSLSDPDCRRSLIPELREGDRVFILRAFTKLYGMAGARLGCGYCRESEILDKMCALVQPWNVSTMAQAAGEAALGCEDFVRETLTLIGEEKAYLLRELRRLGIEVLPGRANYLMLSGVPGLYEKLLHRGILIRSCGNYPGLSDGDCRIAVRTHRENVELIAAIEEVIHG